MLAYLVRRIVFGAAVLIGTSIITFAIAFVVPADPAIAMAGAKADPQTLATIRTELGLDQPVYVQYARYLDRAIHGDLGRSYIRRENVTTLIADRFPATAVLAGAAMALSLILGIAMGAIAAAYRGRAADNVLLVISLALVSIPVFWLGTMLLIARRRDHPLVSARRLQRRDQLDPADSDSRARLGRLLFARSAHQPVRRVRSGLRAHRTRQGSLARPRDSQARDGKRAAAPGHARRSRSRRPALGRRSDRDGLSTGRESGGSRPTRFSISTSR